MYQHYLLGMSKAEIAAAEGVGRSRVCCSCLLYTSRYIRDEKDALKLVNNLIQATTPKGSHESDPFWTKTETALLQAIILMLWQEAPEYEQNFSKMCIRDSPDAGGRTHARLPGRHRRPCR